MSALKRAKWFVWPWRQPRYIRPFSKCPNDIIDYPFIISLSGCYGVHYFVLVVGVFLISTSKSLELPLTMAILKVIHGIFFKSYCNIIAMLHASADGSVLGADSFELEGESECIYTKY